MALERTGVELIADNKAAFLGDLGDASKAVRSFGDAAQDGAKHFANFGDVATGALRRVGEIATDALVDAGKALVGFGADSINVAGDFEAGLNKFQAAAGVSADEVGKFRDQFIQLGRELPVSTKEVEAAATELVSGGIDPATVAAGALRQSLQFAAAAGLSLEDAAVISAKAVGGWTKITDTAATKSDFLTHATNVLTQAALASSTTVDQLALGLYNVQGTAKAAGVSFDETVITLAQLAPSFNSSAEAGNSFKNFLVRLQPTTKPATEAMQELGLYTKETGSAFYDSAGNFVGMEKAAGLLQAATAGLTNEQKISYLQTIFGNDAMGTANALVEQGASGYAAMAQKLSEQNDVQAAAAIQQQGFNTALENAKGSVEALQITLGSVFLPLLTTLFNDTIAPAINTVTDFADAFAKADDPVQFLVDTINTAIPGFTTFATFIGDNLNPILAGLASVIGAVVVPALVSMVIAAAPIVLTLGAIGLAGATLYKAWTEDWGGIQTTLTNFWQTTGQPIFSQVVDWLQVTIPAGLTTLAGFWNDTLLPALTATWNFINTSVIPIFEDVYTEVATNLPKGIQVVSDFWNNTLLPALTDVWAFIDTKVIPILTTLATGTFQNVNTALTTLAGFWNDTLLPAITTTYDFVNDKIVPLFVAIVDVNIAAFNKALDALAGMWKDTLQPALNDVWTFIKDNVIPIFSDVETKGLTPVQTASQVLADLWNNTLSPALHSVSDFVGGALTGAFNGLGTAISTVTGWLTDLKNDIANIKLPDWMTPGSPMPLEIAYRGLGDAIKEVADGALPKLQAGLQMNLNSLIQPMRGEAFTLDDVKPVEWSGGDLGKLVQPAQQIRPPATANQLMLDAIGRTMGQTTNNNFNLTAQYQQQERPSLMQDVRTMQMLFG